MHLPRRGMSWMGPAHPKQLFNQPVLSWRKWLPRQNTIKTKHPARQKSGKHPHKPKPQSVGSTEPSQPPHLACSYTPRSSSTSTPSSCRWLCYPRPPWARKDTCAVPSKHSHHRARLSAGRAASDTFPSVPCLAARHEPLTLLVTGLQQAAASVLSAFSWDSSPQAHNTTVSLQQKLAETECSKACFPLWQQQL